MRWRGPWPNSSSVPVTAITGSLRPASKKPGRCKQPGRKWARRLRKKGLRRVEIINPSNNTGATAPRFLLRKRALQAKLASRKKFCKTGEAVFVNLPQTVDTSRENAHWYGEVVSGPTIYSYVLGNPVNYRDPLGLWSLGASAYEGFGGGVSITGEGWHVGS